MLGADGRPPKKTRKRARDAGRRLALHTGRTKTAGKLILPRRGAASASAVVEVALLAPLALLQRPLRDATYQARKMDLPRKHRAQVEKKGANRLPNGFFPPRICIH
ncbi:hypothetical protein MRX96_032695 [Rhipicephalus microplus]